MSVSIFIPSHITGFFSINNAKNPLKKGSCGAGLLLDKGVTTRIEYSSNDNNNKETYVNVIINGKKDVDNEKITLKTLKIMEKECGLKFKDNLTIYHDIEVPVGSGFGTSASCALGTAIGISKYLNIPISIEKAGQIAHLAEISLGSGLGDVLSQTGKGIVIREYPGAPGIGKIKSIKKSNFYSIGEGKDHFKDLLVLTKTIGEIDTSSIIQNPLQVKNINKIGLTMQKKILNDPTIENFMNCSYEFAKKTNLMSKEVLTIVETLRKSSIDSAMAMLGNTVFAITEKENLYHLENENNKKKNNLKISDFEIHKIDNKGIRII
jgi:pantoate kinase